MKRIFAAALLSATVFSGAYAGTMIEDGRNYANLNVDNIIDKTYEVPLATTDATHFDFELKGYVFGFKMIKANYAGHFDGANYALYTDLKTSGLGALLKKLEIWAVTKGTYNQAGHKPDFHVQQNMDKKNRRVEMNYNNRSNYVHTAIRPPLWTQGTPPASKEERYAADDALSAILNMMMRGREIGADLCTGSVPVFDSKQHYNLRMERAGTKRLKFEGEKVDTLKCHVYYEPVSGFDPEDLPEPEEENTPVNVYFMDVPDLGLSVPIRFSYKISSIKAVIKLTDMRYKTADGTVFQTD